ncbi:MAG TPA: hypothetical protein VHG30_09250 [Microvirga sp.]|nr:hypothetical protein [Microvirga sp.]
MAEFITMPTEAGAIGAVPYSGLDFGATVNTDAIIHQNQAGAHSAVRAYKPHGSLGHKPHRRCRASALVSPARG